MLASCSFQWLQALLGLVLAWLSALLPVSLPVSYKDTVLWIQDQFGQCRMISSQNSITLVKTFFPNEILFTGYRDQHVNVLPLTPRPRTYHLELWGQLLRSDSILLDTAFDQSERSRAMPNLVYFPALRQDLLKYTIQ